MRARPGRQLALLVLVGLLFLALVGRAHAASPRCPSGAACSADSIVPAGKKSRDEGVLDKVGLGSLTDIPWSTLPVALLLSVAIGAAGGFVYSGLVGPSDAARKKSASS